MHVPTKARLAVAAVAASAVSMGVAAPSFAAASSQSGNTVNLASTKLSFTLTNAPGAAAGTYDISYTGTGCTAGGTPGSVNCADVAVPNTATWSLDWKDQTIATSKGQIAHGSGNSVAGPVNWKPPTTTGSGSWKVTLTFTVGSGTTKQTWANDTIINYGPAAGKPTAPTITDTTNGLQVSVTANGGNTSTNGMKYEFDFGAGKGVVGNIVTVPATVGTPVTQSFTYAAAGTYKVTVSTVDAQGQKAPSTPLSVIVTGTGGGGGGGTPNGPAVERLAGIDRYTTGLAVSQKAFPNAGSAPAVVLATGDKFADALSGVPLAKKVGGPLLLTPSAGPDDRVTNEIKRVLKAGGTVYVLGGKVAVPDTVVNALGLPTNQVVRLSGGDRFGTSLAIAHQLGDPKNVVVARGDDGTNLNGFADALAAGPYAADVFGGGGAAVLLTNDTTLDSAVKTYLQGATSIQAVGGPAATAVNGLANVQSPIKGVDRFDTAAQVAAKFTTVKSAGVAYGFKFADALTGAALLANADGPLLLTESASLPPASITALNGIGHALGAQGTIEVFGGTAVITDGVKAAVATAAGGHVVP